MNYSSKTLGVTLRILLILTLGLTGCSTLGQRSQARSFDLLPVHDASSLVFGNLSQSLALLPTFQNLVPQLAGLTDVLESDQVFLSRISNVYLVQTPRSFFLLVHGNFPGFVIEWVLGTRFGFRLDNQLLSDPELTRQFPRLRPMVPGPRTKLPLEDPSISFTRALILDQGTFLLELDGRILPWDSIDPISTRFSELTQDPKPPVFWFSIPLTQQQSLFGLSRIEAGAWQNQATSEDLTQDPPFISSPIWTIDSRFFHGRSFGSQVSRDQRVFQSLLRLSLVAMANQGILSQNPTELRSQVQFSTSEPGLEVGYSEVQGLRLEPGALQQVVQLIRTLLEVR